MCLTLVFQKENRLEFLSSINTANILPQLEHLVSKISEPLDLQTTGTIAPKKIKYSLLTRSNYSASLTNLKCDSLDIASRLLAVAKECQSIDSLIQAVTDEMIEDKSKTEKLEKIFSSVMALEQSLGTCQGDFQRLVLSCNKCLLISNQSGQIEDSKNGEEGEGRNADEEASVSNSSVAEDHPDENADFFAFRDPADDVYSNDLVEAEDKSVNLSLEDDLEILDKKITKKHFAPVLKQLKTKINPINDAMKERERKYLLSKGMDPGKLGVEVGDDVDTDSGSDSDGSEMAARIKSRSKYDEMRSLLQEKQQISFIPNFQLPPVNLGDEEILE